MGGESGEVVVALLKAEIGITGIIGEDEQEVGWRIGLEEGTEAKEPENEWEQPQGGEIWLIPLKMHAFRGSAT